MAGPKLGSHGWQFAPLTSQCGSQPLQRLLESERLRCPQSASQYLRELRSENRPELMCSVLETMLDATHLRPSAAQMFMGITACMRDRLWEHGLALLTAMPKASIATDVMHYNATVSGCGKAEWQVGLLLFEEMCSKQVAPSLVSFNTAIACSGNWDYTY